MSRIDLKSLKSTIETILKNEMDKIYVDELKDLLRLVISWILFLKTYEKQVLSSEKKKRIAVESKYHAYIPSFSFV
jgi:hypothetical protein